MKTKIILFIFSVLVLISCEPQKNSNFENPQQESFDNFLKAKKELEYAQSNEIQKMEFNKKFESELAQYLDSVKIFVNWKGQIKDIKTNEIGQSTQITFEIQYIPEKYREVSFFCSHIVKTENLYSDYVFNRVKSISDYSTVYFDGSIRKNFEGNAVYEYGDMKISYPNYQFILLDISTTKRNDSLSITLKKAIDTDFKVFDLLKLKVLKKISENEWEEKMKDLKLEFIQSTLSETDLQYSKRLRQHLASDFVNE